MKLLLHILLALLFLFPSLPAMANDNLVDEPALSQKVDALLDGAMYRGLIAGGVVVIGSSHDTFLCRAYGKLSGNSLAAPMPVDAIFDIASLTKVVATAPSVLKLAEEGRLSLVDPVCKWFPEFAGRGKDDLLIVHLLTHTSGLDDAPVAPETPMHRAIEGAALRNLAAKPGMRFRYADINFILLGELVRRVSGIGLDRFATENFFLPLEMNDTGFNPGRERAARCAATLNTDNSPLVGQVQDQVSRLLGGVAGHAGLFSTARDLSFFCRMMLNRGLSERGHILSERTVEQMTVPYFSHNGKVLRGLGWDIASPFSSPRGNGFSESSFGHTGYSGCSLWLDPESDMFVVLLTSRLDYKRTREFNQLRGDLSSIAASLLSRGHAHNGFVRKSE